MKITLERDILDQESAMHVIAKEIRVLEIDPDLTWMDVVDIILPAVLEEYCVTRSKMQEHVEHSDRLHTCLFMGEKDA